MSYVKTAKDVQEFLPHGALLVRDGVDPVNLVDLEVQDGKNGPVLVGWAYPNKDFYFELSNVLLQKNGWLVFTGGKRAVLRPLSEQKAQQTKAMMDGA